MTKKTNTPSNTEKTVSEKAEEINSAKFYFLWNSLQPDVRAYKPSNPLLTPTKPITIEVLVPLDPPLIVNAREISRQTISNQDIADPVLTPLGMRYIIDQFEFVMSNPKNEVEEPAADDDWGDDPEEEFVPTGKAKSTSNDEWDDEAEADQSESEKDKDFDEEW